MAIRRILTFCFYVLIWTGNLSAQVDIDLIKTKLQEALDSIIKADQLPGITYSVVLPEGESLNLAAGYDDREAFRQMKPDSRMLVGSTGKTFVSALVLQQAEQGDLYLDAHLSDYFAEEAWYRNIPNHEQITVRMLLQHTSGLPRYVFSSTFKAALTRQPEKSWKPEELLSMIANQKAVHPAGKGWAYSDTNYLLLGLLLEKVSGKSYYTLLQENILNPLQLKTTAPSDKQSLPGLSQGYIGSQDILGLKVKKTVQDGSYAINPQFEWTGGGLISSSVDLALWMKALHTGEVIGDRILLALKLAVSFNDGTPAKEGYGLGTFVWVEDNEQIHYGHEGIMPGYVTSIEYVPNVDLAMAIQVNTDEGFTTRLHGYQLLLKAIVLEGLNQKTIASPQVNQD